MKKPIVVGSVAYDPKIVTIWDIIRDYFNPDYAIGKFQSKQTYYKI